MKERGEVYPKVWRCSYAQEKERIKEQRLKRRKKYRANKSDRKGRETENK